MITNWIDDITKLIGEVSGEGKKKVVTYGIDKIPETISEVPCAFSYITNLRPTYSMGGPGINVWTGVTEVHLTKGISKAELGPTFKLPDRILAACASHLKLNSKVTSFLIDPDQGGIEGPVSGTYGSEAPHYLIFVHWTVVENVTGHYTVGI